MHLTINGRREDIPDISTVADLLHHYDLAPVRVAVEVNQELVTRGDFADRRLQDGDRVEIVTFVGGG